MANTKCKKFQTQLEGAEGKVRLYLPFDPHEAWGKQKRHRVKGKLGKADFASSVGAGGGRFFIPINKALQATAGVGAGDRVHVELEPETVADIEASSDLPEDLARALAKRPTARTFFAGLSRFYRTQYTSWIESAKRPETRASRVEKVAELLEEGRKQRA